MLRATVALALTVVAAPAAARSTIAIAPLATDAGSEYQWIGTGIADALALRIHNQPQLNALTLRQVSAAMRHDNIQPAEINDVAVASKLGKQLGATLIMVGQYTARWPDIEMVLKTIDPQAGKVLNTHRVNGDLGELVELEARVAKLLAAELGAEKPDVATGAFGTKNLRAWRSVALGQDIINWQSLSPTAADPNAPLGLPQSAVEKALGLFEEAAGLDPEYGEAWASLGVAQALLGKTSAAWKSLGKATSEGAGHQPTAVLGATFVRMREGKFDDAVKILSGALARHPGFTHARGYLGQLYNHLGRHRESLKVWEEYASLVPNQPWVLAQRGYTKSKLKDHVNAIADTIAAVDLVPQSPTLLLELASRYIDAGKLVGAEDALLHAMELHPNESNIYVRLGYVYLLQNKDELAIPITEKALVSGSFDGNRKNMGYAHLNLARAYGRKGDLDKAFEHLRLAKENGSVSLREIEDDPKLASLRGDKRYKSVAGAN